MAVLKDELLKCNLLKCKKHTVREGQYININSINNDSFFEENHTTNAFFPCFYTVYCSIVLI